MNQQRTAVYGLRNAILDGANFTERIEQMLEETAEEVFFKFYNERHPQSSDFASLNTYLKRIFTVDITFSLESVQGKSKKELLEEVVSAVKAAYSNRSKYFEEQAINFGEIESMLLLQLLDQSWKQHLYELDQVQKSVGLRAYGQKDPLIEYQKESFSLYQTMMTKVRDLFVEYIFRLQLPPKRSTQTAAQEGRAASEEESGQDGPHKIGRNDLCPCGSGKKYKKCCGK